MKTILRGLAGAGMAALSIVVAAAAPARAEEPLEALVSRLAAERSAMIMFDEALRGKRISTDIPEGTPLEVARSILADYGVELVDDEVEGRAILRAFLQRNVSQSLGAGRALKLGPDDPIPAGNRLVTKTYRIKHADVNTMHVMIRSAQARDPRRVGNLVADVAGRILVLTDLSSAMRQYEALIADVDRPAPARNVRIEVEVWAVPGALAEAVQAKPGEARATLAGAKEARRITSQSGLIADRAQRAEARATTPEDEKMGKAGAAPLGFAFEVHDNGPGPTMEDDTSVSFAGALDAAAGGVGLRWSLVVRTPTVRASLPERTVSLRAGEWTVAHAGEPGFVLLVSASPVE